MATFISHSPAETESLGEKFGHAAESGLVIALSGELGAGKTSCARSLLHALGVTAHVRSPTYTLVDSYSLANLDCVHIDLYRLSSAAEALELGLRDMTGPKSLMLIEWPENGGAAVPAADVNLRLFYAGHGRSASLTALSPLGRQWLLNLVTDTSLAPYVSNLT